jgi:hypothetical protein
MHRQAMVEPVKTSCCKSKSTKVVAPPKAYTCKCKSDAPVKPVAVFETKSVQPLFAAAILPSAAPKPALEIFTSAIEVAELHNHGPPRDPFDRPDSPRGPPR